MKRFNISLPILVLCLSLSHAVYAGWSVQWDETSRTMTIRITEGDSIAITKHPTTGGLAINGACSGILTSNIHNLIIHGDDGNNKIDLSLMNQDDFPWLKAQETEGSIRIEVYAGGGDDFVWGSDLGNIIGGGDGEDELWGGDHIDRSVGGEGRDEISGYGGNDSLDGEGGYDFVDGGMGYDQLYGFEGRLCAGIDFDMTYVVNRTEKPPGNKMNSNQASLVKGTRITIIDSTGIDTLNFSLFQRSVVLDLDLHNTYQFYTDSSDTISLYGLFEYFIGTEYNDIIYVDPDLDVPRYVDGGGSEGADTLYVDAMGKEASDDGYTITIQDYQPITYDNFDICVITNQPDSDVERDHVDSPSQFQLFQNYPNPFNPETKISFTLPKVMEVQLEVFDLQGRVVITLARGKFNQGNHHMNFDASDYPSGVYTYRLTTPEFTQARSMILMK